MHATISAGKEKKKSTHKRVMPKRKMGRVRSRTLKGGNSKKRPNEQAF